MPEILDGLFRILEDTNLEVKKMCETALGEFLRIIKADPSKVNFGAMINILINHAQEKNDELVQVGKLSFYVFFKFKFIRNLKYVIDLTKTLIIIFEMII